MIGDGPDEGALLLFDLVLGGELEGGMKLLTDLRNRRSDVRSAIITSSVDANGELQTQARLAEDYGVAPDSLLLSTKEHLTDQGCKRFVDLLRITANSRRLHALRDHVAQAAERYGQEARGRLAKFDDRVLEDIVFRSSHVEGAWEVDSLLRVLNILQRDQARIGQLEDEEAHRLLDQARELVHLQYEPHGPSGPQAAELMALENYDPGEALNPLGLPLANGDVFKIGTRHYVLLEQPCYLQVRADGKRGRETPCLMLLEVGARPRDPNGNPTERPRWELPPGHGLGPGICDIFFTPRHPVAATVLDLCTMNHEGQACYRVTGASTRPPLTVGLSKLQRRRLKHFARLADQVSETIAALKENQPQRIHKRIVATVLGGQGLVKVSFKPGESAVITYRCERVVRLASTYADAALSAFHVHEARAAHEHDLGRFR